MGPQASVGSLGVTGSVSALPSGLQDRGHQAASWQHTEQLPLPSRLKHPLERGYLSRVRLDLG